MTDWHWTYNLDEIDKDHLHYCCAVVEICLDWVCVCQGTNDYIADDLLVVSDPH